MKWDHKPSAKEEKKAKELWYNAEIIWDAVKTSQYRKETPEIEEMIALLTQVAEMGDTDAMFRLGRLYWHDKQIIMHNPEKAEYWYEKAANKGDIDAMYQLAVMHEHTPSKACKWLDKITSKDDFEPDEEEWYYSYYADAYYRKAITNLEYVGTKENLDFAITNCIKACRDPEHYEANFLLAMIYLGRYKYTLNTVRYTEFDYVDYTKAAIYLAHGMELERRRVCKPLCSYLYATLLYEGKGVRENKIEAYKLFYDIAKKSGSILTFSKLTDIYLSGSIFPVDYRMAYRSILLYLEEVPRDAVLIREKKEMIEAQLSKADKLRIQQETRADYFKEEICAENYLKQHSYLNMPESSQTISESENTEHADTLTFIPISSEMEKIRKDFDISKVEFRIWIDTPIEQGKELDFEVLKLKYADYALQVKNMNAFKGTKICRSCRNLMFRLAVATDPYLHECRDENERSRLVKKIIQKADPDEVCAINRLFKLIFYEGKRVKDSPAINKEDGRLLLKLKVCAPTDKSVSGLIKEAADFDDLLHKKEIAAGGMAK